MVCGEPHKNGGWGLCDTHLEAKEEIEKEDKFEAAFEAFLSSSKRDKWRRVYKELYDKYGY